MNKLMVHRNDRIFLILGPIVRRQKAKKRARGRRRVCPNFYCSLLVTGMCTLILWIITASQEQHATQHIKKLQ